MSQVEQTKELMEHIDNAFGDCDQINEGIANAKGGAPTKPKKSFQDFGKM